MPNSHDSPTPFDAYEIHGVRQFGRGAARYCEQVPDDQVRFFSLYGHIPGQGVECIGDFKTRQLAEEIRVRITGRPATLKEALAWLATAAEDLDDAIDGVTEEFNAERTELLAACRNARTVLSGTKLPKQPTTKE